MQQHVLAGLKRPGDRPNRRIQLVLPIPAVSRIHPDSLACRRKSGVRKMRIVVRALHDNGDIPAMVLPEPFVLHLAPLSEDEVAPAGVPPPAHRGQRDHGVQLGPRQGPPSHRSASSRRITLTHRHGTLWLLARHCLAYRRKAAASAWSGGCWAQLSSTTKKNAKPSYVQQLICLCIE